MFRLNYFYEQKQRYIILERFLKNIFFNKIDIFEVHIL